MNNVKKKLGSLILAFAIAVTTVFGVTTPVQAASGNRAAVTKVIDEASGTAQANEERLLTFTVDKNDGVGMYVFTNSPVSVQVLLVDSAYQQVAAVRTFTETDYEKVDVEGQTLYGFCDVYDAIPAGDYAYVFKFSQDVQTYIRIVAASAASVPSKVTVTQGYTQKITLTGGVKASKWTSRDKSIAMVDKNGKVTAKKKGKTKVIATLDDGKTTLECTVVVAANKYSASKGTYDDVDAGQSAIVPCAASFDSKGNLVIKAQVINNNKYRLGQIKNLKFVVKDSNGKLVGTYQAAKTNVSVQPQSDKTYSFVIKKANLKKKKVDLRNATVDVKITNAKNAAVYYR